MMNKTSHALQTAILLLLSGCAKDRDAPLLWLLEEAHSHPGIYFSRTDGRGSSSEYFRARDEIIYAIDRAAERIEMWCYGFDEPELVASIARALNRGVVVTITGSPDEDYTIAKRAGLTVNIRAKTGIQHVKLILIDNRVLVTGTGNFTESCFFHNNNVYIVIEIPPDQAMRIARSLTNEERPSERIDLPFDGRMVISPSRGRLIQSKIVQAILRARYTIRYMIFSHTDPVISAALYHASRRGVIIEGVHDDEFGRESFPPDSQGSLLLKRVPSNYILYLDGNRSQFEKEPGQYHGGHLHHKTIIVDNETVLTGSYNWSRNARDSNLETWMEFRNPLFVNAFIEEFERVRNPALPFYSVNTPSGQNHNLTVSNGSVCWDGGAPSLGFTLFSGQGLYFRAESFPRSLLASGCHLYSDHGSISAGLMSGSTHLIEPDHVNGLPDTFVYSYDSIHDAPSEGKYPCERASDCDAERLFRGSVSSGWIWTDGKNDYRGIRKWDSSGISQDEPIQRISPEFYRFTPGSGDAVLFLRDSLGRVHAACLRSGSTLGGPIAYFRETFEWETDTAFECIQSE